MDRTCRWGAVLLVMLVPLRATAQLSNKAAETVDRIADAYRAGHLAEAHRLARSLLENATDEQIAAASDRLREHELGLTIVELAARARVEMVIQGQGGKIARPTRAELSAAVVALDERLARLTDPIKKEVAAGYPAVIPDNVLDEKVAAIGPLVTQIEQARLILTHLQQLGSRVRPAERDQIEPAARLILARRLADEQKELDDFEDRLVGRLVDFNLMRLASAASVMGNESARFERRFRAVERSLEAIETLQQNWERYEKWKRRSGGLDHQVLARWRWQEQQVRQQAGPLIEKVYHFSEGARWWLRGRFGQGPVGNGMMKIVPDLRPDRAIEALAKTPVLMPRQIQKPQDPLATPQPFPLARRHLAWWQLPTRSDVTLQRLLRVGRNSQIVDALAAEAAQEAMAGRAETQVMKLELAQLVGYVEYTNALAHFDRLIEMTTPAEQRAIEDFVGEDDRFVVHSNLSAKYDRLDPMSTLRLPVRAADPRAARPHERRGLSWIMALARIELAAMRAGYGPEPFETAPTPFERDAFIEILFDDARQHYYECRTQTRVGAAPARPTPFMVPRLLQLDRRLALTQQMVSAFRYSASGSLNPAQHAELDGWLAWLASEHNLVRSALSQAMGGSAGAAVGARRFGLGFSTPGVGPAQSPETKLPSPPAGAAP